MKVYVREVKERGKFYFSLVLVEESLEMIKKGNCSLSTTLHKLPKLSPLEEVGGDLGSHNCFEGGEGIRANVLSG